MKNRMFTRFIAVLFMLSISIPAFAAGQITETEEERIERVYAEILTGNITDHQDVIEVALAQYQPTVSTYSTNSSGNDASGSLQITQELGSVANTDGSTITSYAATALIVVDQEGNQVSPASLNDYVDSVSEDGGLNEFSVYATHTMYINVRFTDPDNMLAPGTTLQINRVTTALIYGTAIGASQLDQTYEVFVGNAEPDNYTGSKTYSYPSAGTYTYYPPDSTEHVVPNTIGSYMKSTAAVHVSSKVLYIACEFSMD